MVPSSETASITATWPSAPRSVWPMAPTLGTVLTVQPLRGARLSQVFALPQLLGTAIRLATYHVQ